MAVLAAEKARSLSIEDVLYELYGVGIMGAPTEALIWAAEKLMPLVRAKSELRRANALRQKYGAPLAYPAYGTRLF